MNLVSIVSGADFTNTFHLLSSFLVDTDPSSLENFLDKISKQCASIEELKVAYKPQMDPRYFFKIKKQWLYSMFNSNSLFGGVLGKGGIMLFIL